jgi:hypothetical protein
MRRIKVAATLGTVIAAATFGLGVTHALPAAACNGTEVACADPDFDFPSIAPSGCLLTVLGVCEVPNFVVCMNEHEGSGGAVLGNPVPLPEDLAPFCTVA